MTGGGTSSGGGEDAAGGPPLRLKLAPQLDLSPRSNELPAAAYGRQLLSPGARPPIAVAARGRQVCSCFDVSESAIAAELDSIERERAALSPEAALAALQQRLKCGTNCGSCIPELKRIVRLRRVTA